MGGEWQFTDFYDIDHGYKLLDKESDLKQFTDITVLLDRSGSMSNLKYQMEHAFDTFVSEHKANPTTKLTLIQFDSQNPYEVVYQNVPITAVERLNVQARGMTPLNDAFAMTIDRTGERLAALTPSERPDQVLLVVITDGAENASRNFSRADVNLRVHNQTSKYNWQFVYLGANADAFKEAASYGIDLGKTMWFDVNRLDTAIRSMASNTASYSGTVGNLRGTNQAAEHINFTEQQLTSSAGDNEEILKKLTSINPTTNTQ